MPTAYALIMTALAAAVPLAVAVTPAQGQECYDTGYEVVDLGTMCGSQRAAVSAPAAAPSTGPFPAWLLNNDSRKTQQTGTAHGDNYSRWLYANRYALTLRVWPHTISASNRTELVYLDCSTFTIRRESVGLGGGVTSWSLAPAQAPDPAGHTATYSATCQGLGLPE